MSKHFQDKEFACKCGCGFCKPDPRLIAGLEKLRTKLGDKPIIINSGCRCANHNAETRDAAKKSLHTKGVAADIIIKGVTPSQVARIANTIDCFKRSGIIWYDEGFTHLDVGRIVPYHAHCIRNDKGKREYIRW